MDEVSSLVVKLNFLKMYLRNGRELMTGPGCVVFRLRWVRIMVFVHGFLGALFALSVFHVELGLYGNGPLGYGRPNGYYPLTFKPRWNLRDYGDYW